MSLSLSQAQWLIHFMRNLPGSAPPELHQGAYEEAMAAQRAEAHAAAGAFSAGDVYASEPQVPWQEDGTEFEPY